MEYLIIDGYNFLYADSNLAALAERDLELARHKLVASLTIYASQKKVKITLIFDGGKGSGQNMPFSLGRIKVIYSRKPLSADDLIVKIVEKAAKVKGITLVTSDRQLAGAVRSKGAKVIDSNHFMMRVQKGPSPEGLKDKKPEGMSEVELDKWLKIFGEADKD